MRWLPLIFPILALVSCQRAEAAPPGPRWSAAPGLAASGHLARPHSTNLAPFEGGNIGRITRRNNTAFDLSLRSDNDDALPKFWRQWFYLKIDDVPVGKTVTLTITGAGMWTYYVPVYSYDNEHWQKFSERDVSQPKKTELRIRHAFRQKTVWLARYNPYTYSDLTAYLETLAKRRGVTQDTIGDTPRGRAIPFVEITDDSVAEADKSRVVIHARTHPGEVGSSFLLEGFLDAVTADTPIAKQMRKHLVIDVVPMLNVDGVIAGNNRVSPTGVNLEGKWYADAKEPMALDEERVPPEVSLMHKKVLELAQSPAKITVALNLHSSGGEPDDNVFFFPHFGPAKRGYGRAEASLYQKQITFIQSFIRAHGPRWFNPPPKDGTRAFLAKAVPETWWWKNFKDQVMALSIESTYGRAGGAKRWIEPADMRKMGASMAAALARYHGIVATPKRGTKLAH